MLKKSRAVLGGTVLTIFMLCGCGGGYEVEYAVGAPPPPIVEEPYGVAPGPDFVWTPGYYYWYGGHYEWRHGEWRRRPHAEDRWVAPHYEQHGGHYVYREGGWQHGGEFHH